MYISTDGCINKLLTYLLTYTNRQSSDFWQSAVGNTDTRIGCLVARQTTDHWAHATGPWPLARLWCDSSRFLLQGGKCCVSVCSVSPSSLLCPTCLGLLFARLLRQVELGRRSASAKAGRLRQSGSLYSHSTAKAFIASPTETGRRSQQLSSTPVSSLSCLAARLGRRLSDYTLRYRDTLAYDIAIQFLLTIQALLSS